MEIVELVKNKDSWLLFAKVMNVHQIKFIMIPYVSHVWIYVNLVKMIINVKNVKKMKIQIKINMNYV